MDTPVSLQTPTSSDSSNSIDQNSDAESDTPFFTSRRASFYVNYHPRQNFSLPDSIIHNLTKYPSSLKGYEKLIQTCKYFFTKNPIIIIPCLTFSNEFDEWQIFIDNEGPFYLDNLVAESRFWITDQLNIENLCSTDQKYLFPFYHKIYQSDIKELNLFNQTIYFDDLKFLASSECEEIYFKQVTVVDQEKKVVPIEKIIELLTKVKIFHYKLQTSTSITFKTVDELLKIPHFSNFTDLYLSNIPQDFDIEHFYDHIKNNNKTNIWLYFSKHLSEAYCIRLQAIINQIIATTNHDYIIPYIDFHGIDPTSSNNLWKLFKMR